MAFDFPASPAVGESANGYTWNGQQWMGNPGMAGVQTEQFFDLSGQASVDIQVPAWAKGAQIVGSAFVTGAVAICMRVSFDGTTFAAGASDYQNAGGSHQTGSAGFTTNAAVAAAQMLLTVNADSTTLPHNFTAEMGLVRATAAQFFHLKTYAKLYDSAAATQYRTWWGQCMVQPATGGSNLAIKALRIMHGTGGTLFPAGSSIHVKWIGDSAAVPISSAISDAPSDGRTYLRKNGVWVPAGTELISTTDCTGKLVVDVPIPAGPKKFRLELNALALAPGGAAEYMWCFVSTDGTTFLKTDGGYNWRQIYTAGSGVAPAQWLSGGGSAMGIILTAIGAPLASSGHSINGTIDLFPGDGVSLMQTYHQTSAMAAQGIYQMNGAGYYGSAVRVKALRFQSGINAGFAWGKGSIDLFAVA